MKGHGEAVEFIKKFNVPLLVTGGGGYTKHNVARCWTYETALLLGIKIPDHLPVTDYNDYFGPDFNLNVAAHKVMEDCNSKQVSRAGFKGVFVGQGFRGVFVGQGLGCVC